MGISLQGPIPGQSLTMEPGNSPWEQPPLYADNEKAIAFHLDRLNKKDRMADLMFLLERGFPIETFVDSLTTKAVMEGYHTVDNSTLISPVIHEYIKRYADNAGIKYREWAGPTDEEREDKKFKQRLQLTIGDPNYKIDEPKPVATEPVRSNGLIPRRK